MSLSTTRYQNLISSLYVSNPSMKVSSRLTYFRELANLFIWSSVEVQLAIASSESGQAHGSTQETRMV